MFERCCASQELCIAATVVRRFGYCKEVLGGLGLPLWRDVDWVLR